MSEEPKELTKEEFLEQMEDFDSSAAPEILEVLDSHKYLLAVEVLGLVSIARALINKFGDDFLMKSAVDLLNYKSPEKEEQIEEADDIIKETE